MLLDPIDPVLRGIVRRTLRVTLDPADGRNRNQDAMEVLASIQLALWERLEGEKDSTQIRDFQHYAAKVAYNKCHEYLRKASPERASLKNKLQYFFRHRAGYALWSTPQGELLCGLPHWAGSSEAPGDLPRDLIERIADLGLTQVQLMPPRDWDRVLKNIFEHLQKPVALDVLVSALCPLVGVDSNRPIEDSDSELPSVSAVLPPDQLRIHELLQALWNAIHELEPVNRVAYLLNPTWLEIEWLPYNNVATIREIAAAVGLTDEQFARLWALLPLEERARELTPSLTTGDQKFALLWRYLPLRDVTIATLLGCTAQDVINLRMMARRQLASRMRRLR